MSRANTANDPRFAGPHIAASMPPSGNGYAVCRCGATAGVDQGRITGGWHTCALCCHPDFHKAPAELAP